MSTDVEPSMMDLMAGFASTEPAPSLTLDDLRAQMAKLRVHAKENGQPQTIIHPCLVCGKMMLWRGGWPTFRYLTCAMCAAAHALQSGLLRVMWPDGPQRSKRHVHEGSRARRRRDDVRVRIWKRMFPTQAFMLAYGDVIRDMREPSGITSFVDWRPL